MRGGVQKQICTDRHRSTLVAAVDAGGGAESCGGQSQLSFESSLRP